MKGKPVIDKGAERSPAFEAKRIDLLRQVAAIFASSGYHQTSVGALAERLGVSKPVLYYYADNKEDLLYQIFVASREELDAAVAATERAHLTGAGKLRRFFTTYVQLQQTDIGRCFVTIDLRALEARTREKEKQARRAVEQAVRDMIIQGQQDGSIRECDPTIVSRALFGSFNAIPTWFHSGESLKSEDIADAYLDIFIYGIGRG